MSNAAATRAVEASVPIGVTELECAVQHEANAAEAFYIVGDILARQGLLDDAATSYQAALQHSPSFAEAHNNLGVLLAERGELEAAIAHYLEALRSKPSFAEAHYNLGNAFKQRHDLESAIHHYLEALHLRPEWPEAHANLGLAFAALGQPEQAERCHARAIELRPTYAEAHSNLGLALEAQARIAEALESYTRAIELSPSLAKAHFNRAQLQLFIGDYERGWPGYEQRWNMPGFSWPSCGKPTWDGCDPRGKTILLRTEQGLGDTLQFIRYTSPVRQLGCRIVVECQPSLVPLLKNCADIDQLVARGDPLPEFDLHAPLLSLPAILGTTQDTVPRAIPYLVADPTRIQQWRETLSPIEGYKIGISWQGDTHYELDRQRSIALRHFARLGQVEGTLFINLQKGHGNEQLPEMRDHFFVHVMEGLDDGPGAFVDTAAIMENLDLVIAPNSAIAHLAGGLGVPVWVAVPFAPDWRYPMGREDTPWYPTMRVFRQPRLNDWESVFEQMRAELELIVRAPRHRTSPIRIAIALSELIDRITILEIKSQQLADPERLSHVQADLARLIAVREATLEPSGQIDALTNELRLVNEAIWQAEDAVRTCEARKVFDPDFIAEARRIYRQNDRRAAIKRQIDALLRSQHFEEKAYPSYT